MLLALRKEMMMLTIMTRMMRMTILMMTMMMMVVKCSIVSWASADSIPGKLPWVNKQKRAPQAFYKNFSTFADSKNYLKNLATRNRNLRRLKKT